MAFYDDKEEDKQDPNAPANAAASAPPTSNESQLVGGGSSGSPGAPQAKATNAPDKPGNFVGLNDYLNANKVQSQKLGDQVAGNLNENVNQASQAVAGLGDQFGQKVKAGEIPDFDKAAEQGTNIVNQAAKTGQVSDADKQRYGQVANAQYSGPGSLQDASDIYQPTVQQVQKATDQANLANTEEGKQQLLRDMNKSPGYTTGAQRFDSYLLNDPNSKAKIAAAQTNAGQLQGQLDAQNAQATQQADQAKAQSQAIQDQIKQAFGGAVSNYQNTVNNQLTDAQKYGNDLTQRVNTGKLTQDDLDKMGLQNMPTYGIDFKNFYQQNVPTLAGVTTPEEKAQYDALQSLSGGTAPDLYGGADPTQFSGYTPTTNNDAFLNAVNDQKKLYEVTQAKQKANDVVNYIRNGQGNGTGVVGGSNLDNWLQALSGGQNADEIQNALNNMETRWNAQSGRTQYYTPAEQQLRDYLNNTLTSARGKTLIGQTPDMPTNNDGSIDWSKIVAPKGK